MRRKVKRRKPPSESRPVRIVDAREPGYRSARRVLAHGLRALAVLAAVSLAACASTPCAPRCRCVEPTAPSVFVESRDGRHFVTSWARHAVVPVVFGVARVEYAGEGAPMYAMRAGDDAIVLRQRDARQNERTSDDARWK